ncbi:hypothetical protein Tsubulata_023428, partial [Turnera subulata]
LSANGPGCENELETKKLPRPGKGGYQSHGLTEEEARVRAIAEIVNSMVDLSRKNQTVDLNAIKSAACRKYGLARAPKLVEMIAALPESERESLLPKLRAKPVRTASGIAVVAVMSKPHRCPHIATTGNICVYCPGGPDSDFEYSTQSYTGYEPTSMRAIRARYNPYVQARSRIDQLKRLGHSVDKVEFILMGGTFMSLPADYRDYFIRNLHDALSGHTSANVEEAVAYSEHGATKCIGMTIETTYEDVARDTNRGHTVAAVADCFCLAKDAGFKVVAHMMPDLPNVGVERDMESFKEFFESPSFRADGLKIYPTLVIRGTGLYELWKTGRYRNYPPEQLVDIVARILAMVPPWTRVYRVQRDIPMPLVTSGVEKGNLRELALARMDDLGLKCRDVRTREAGIQDIHHKIKPEEVELVRRDYTANEGWETFLSYEDTRQDILVGLLRLRRCGRNVTCPELVGKCSIVRELHVYGTAVPVHGREADKLQHQGYGTLLMEEAERIARREHRSTKIAVISGVGTRHYYRKLGYELEGPYMDFSHLCGPGRNHNPPEMLKSTFAPVLSTFPTKPKQALHGLPSRAIITSAFTQTPPPVHQNVSPTKTPPLLHHQQPPASAYVHLPFCRKRCHYCDFPIVALGSSTPTDDDPRISNYIGLLLREIAATNPESNPHPPLETVFFGGGTPSLVSPKLVKSVLDTLRVKFGVCEDAEISMEMDPGTFGAEKLKEMVGLGVNRVSLGVQAFQEELLKACGRAHGVKDIYEAIEIVGSCGVENWSLDLISSLPRQTIQMWEESLRLTVDAGPKHVSVYDLQVEQGTKFGNLYTPGEFPLPSETQSAEFYRTASRMLSDASYCHYEISSYCKEGYECKHNYTYWKNKPYYAFGLGSASYLNGLRFSRPRKLKEYASYVQNLEDGLVDGCGKFDPKDLAMDIVMLSFRTAKGLDLRSFSERFGGSLVHSLCKVYKPYIESGHVVCLDEERKGIAADEFNTSFSGEEGIARGLAYMRLSDPDGFLLSNELISLAFGIFES